MGEFSSLDCSTLSGLEQEINDSQMDRKLNRFLKFRFINLFEATAFSFGYWGLAFVLSKSVFSNIKHRYILLMTFGFIMICVLKILFLNKKRKS